MKQTYQYLLFSLLFLTATNVNADVIHWLSKIAADPRMVVNNSAASGFLSTNGRYATFFSAATNLVAHDDNQKTDVFWHDSIAGETRLVSVTQSGVQLAIDSVLFSAPTSDGQYVAFVSNSPLLPGGNGLDNYIYLKNMVTGEVENHSDHPLINQFDIDFSAIHLSDDGEFVIFTTSDNLINMHDDSSDQIYRKNLTTDTFELISLSQDGMTIADDDLRLLDVSDNGRFVLMAGNPSNVVATPLNNFSGNYILRDTMKSSNILVNVATTGEGSAENDFFVYGGVSNAGTVVFQSAQTDLLANDTNGITDVFYYDGNSLSRINVESNGTQIVDEVAYLPTISGDGTQIAFASASNQLGGDNEKVQVYSYSVAQTTLTVITENAMNEQGNGTSLPLHWSLDGDELMVNTAANNLSNQMVNGRHIELFTYKNIDQSFNKISVPAFNPDTVIDDVEKPRISSDQLTVVYQSKSNNLTVEMEQPDSEFNIYLLDRNSNQSTLIGRSGVLLDLSANGRYVVYQSEYNQPTGSIDLGSKQLFLYDRNNQTHLQIDDGTEAKVNDDGKVVFTTEKGISNMDTNGEFDAYLFDSSDSSTSLVSVGTDDLAAGGFTVDIGGVGSDTSVVYASLSSNIVVNDTNDKADVFMLNWPSGTAFRISETAAGVEADSDSYLPAISNNGAYVTFITFAQNLTTEDYSEANIVQILYYDRATDVLQLVTKNSLGLPLYGQIQAESSVTNSGRYVAYIYSDDGDNTDFNSDMDEKADVVLVDIQTGNSKIISVDTEGSQVDDPVGINSQVVENMSVSPPLVGVVFAASEADELTGVPHHPGFSEAFLFQQGGPEVNLNVQIVGMGQVSGTSGINCSNSCDYSRPLGTDLTLVASPAIGYVFNGWFEEFGGCDDDNNPCDLIMDRSKTLSATFIDLNEIIFDNGFE